MRPIGFYVAMVSSMLAPLGPKARSNMSVRMVPGETLFHSNAAFCEFQGSRFSETDHCKFTGNVN